MYPRLASALLCSQRWPWTSEHWDERCVPPPPFLKSLLGIKPRALDRLSKHSTNSVTSQPWIPFHKKNFVNTVSELERGQRGGGGRQESERSGDRKWLATWEPLSSRNNNPRVLGTRWRKRSIQRPPLRKMNQSVLRVELLAHFQSIRGMSWPGSFYLMTTPSSYTNMTDAGREWTA